jgi:hypothetical protein
MQYTLIEPKLSLRAINQTFRTGVLARNFERSGGTHLSQILQHIARDSGRLQEKIIFGRNSFAPLQEHDLPACMAVGFAMEELLVRMHPWILRSGELVSDGIAMSPDGVTFNSRRHLLSPDKPVTILHEFKATWKSARKPLEEQLSYLQQTKAYCRALDTQYCILWIFHVNGDYQFGDSPDAGPRLKQWHIKYAPWELESNWHEILSKKQEVEQRGKQDDR